MIQTHFSNIEHVLINDIYKAQRSIKIAVAWFTNHILFETLLKKLYDGITVELIIRDDYINNSTNSLFWADFLDKGGKLYFSNSKKNLHHKYCIIDDNIVIFGSYNWTYQAERVNQESIIIVSESVTANAFKRNFEELIIESSLMSDISMLNYRTVIDAPVDEAHFMLEEESILNDNKSFEAILDEAKICYLNKRYHEAISILSSGWVKIDTMPEAYETMAWSCARAGKSEDAISYVEKGMLLGKGNPEFHNVIGFVYDINGQSSKAIMHFDEAIKLAPNLTPYYWNKIFALDKIGNNSIADKVATTLRIVASTILKKKGLHSSYDRMHAYIDRGNVSTDRVNREQDGKKAKAIFDTLDVSQQDLHDLDSIKVLLS